MENTNAKKTPASAVVEILDDDEPMSKRARYDDSDISTADLARIDRERLTTYIGLYTAEGTRGFVEPPDSLKNSVRERARRELLLDPKFARASIAFLRMYDKSVLAEVYNDLLKVLIVYFVETLVANVTHASPAIVDEVLQLAFVMERPAYNILEEIDATISRIFAMLSEIIADTDSKRTFRIVQNNLPHNLVMPLCCFVASRFLDDMRTAARGLVTVIVLGSNDNKPQAVFERLFRAGELWRGFADEDFESFIFVYKTICFQPQYATYAEQTFTGRAAELPVLLGPLAQPLRRPKGARMYRMTIVENSATSMEQLARHWAWQLNAWGLLAIGEEQAYIDKMLLAHEQRQSE